MNLPVTNSWNLGDFSLAHRAGAQVALLSLTACSQAGQRWIGRLRQPQKDKMYRLEKSTHTCIPLHTKSIQINHIYHPLKKRKRECIHSDNTMYIETYCRPTQYIPVIQGLTASYTWIINHLLPAEE